MPCLFVHTSRRQVRSIAVDGNFTNLTKSGNDMRNDATSLGVTNDRLDLDESGEELGYERTDRKHGSSEFSHIVGDNHYFDYFHGLKIFHKLTQ